LRQPKEALAICGEQISFAADQGFPLFHATGIVYEAGGALLQGKALQALPGLIKGLDAYRATGAALALPYYLGLLGSALIDSGRPADADATLNKALSVAEESHDRCHEAELLRLKGELALSHGGNSEAAKAYFHRSIELAKQQQSKAWELRSATSLARLYRRQGRHADARDRVAEALGKFTQGFGTPDLQDANLLLGELGNA